MCIFPKVKCIQIVQYTNSNYCSTKIFMVKYFCSNK